MDQLKREGIVGFWRRGFALSRTQVRGFHVCSFKTPEKAPSLDDSGETPDGCVACEDEEEEGPRIVKTSVEARELRSAQRLERFKRLASTRTLEGFFAARVLQGWAPRFGGRRCRKQRRTRQESGCEQKESLVTAQAVKPRRERLRRARPSGLPNGRVREAAAREDKVRRRVRSKRVEVRVGPKRARGNDVQGFEGSTDGACLLDFGSRLGRWHKKCLQTAVLGLWRDSAKKDLKMRLLRMCSNNRGSGLAGGVLEASNFRNVGKVLRCSGKRVCVVDVECTADFFVGRCLGVRSLGSARGTFQSDFLWRHGWQCHHAGGRTCWNHPEGMPSYRHRATPKRHLTEEPRPDTGDPNIDIWHNSRDPHARAAVWQVPLVLSGKEGNSAISPQHMYETPAPCSVDVTKQVDGVDPQPMCGSDQVQKTTGSAEP